MDTLTAEKRSELMRSVRKRDTRPELRVRSIAHAMGLRFRVQRNDLPGTPDIVFPKYRTCLFVHGCFWHRHKNCRLASTPQSHVEFWNEKFERNTERDHRKVQELEDLGWKVHVIWECQTRDHRKIEALLKDWLHSYT